MKGGIRTVPEALADMRFARLTHRPVGWPLVLKTVRFKDVDGTVLVTWMYGVLECKPKSKCTAW